MLSLISSGFTNEPVLYGGYHESLIYSVYIDEMQTGIYHNNTFTILKDYISKISANILMSSHSIYICDTDIKCLHKFKLQLSNIKVINDRVLCVYVKGGYGWYDLSTNKLEDVLSWINNPVISDASFFLDTLVFVKDGKLVKIDEREIDLNQQGSHLSCNSDILLVWDVDIVYYTTNLNEFGLLRLQIHATDIVVSKINNINYIIVVGVANEQISIHFYTFMNSVVHGPYTLILPNGDKLLRRSPKSIDDLFSFNSPKWIINQIVEQQLSTPDLLNYCLELSLNEQKSLIDKFKVKIQDLRMPINASAASDAIYIFCTQDIMIIRPSTFIELLLHQHTNIHHFIPNFSSVLPLFYKQYSITNFKWQLSDICNALTINNSNHFKQVLIPNPLDLPARQEYLPLLPLIEYLINRIESLMRSSSNISSFENNNSNGTVSNLIVNITHELNFSCFVILGICCKLLLSLFNYQDLHLDHLLYKCLITSYKSGVLEWLIRHEFNKSSYLNSIVNQLDILSLISKYDSRCIYSYVFTNTNDFALINKQLAISLLPYQSQCQLLVILPKLPCFLFLIGIQTNNPTLIVKCASYLSSDNSSSASTPMRGGFSISKCISLFRVVIASPLDSVVTCSAIMLLNYIKCVYKYDAYILYALVPVYIQKSIEETGTCMDNKIINQYFDMGKVYDFNCCILVLRKIEDNTNYYRDVILSLVNTSNMDLLKEFNTTEIYPRLLTTAKGLFHEHMTTSNKCDIDVDGNNAFGSNPMYMISRLYHVVCRLLLMDKQYSQLVSFAFNMEPRLLKYNTIHAYSTVLESVKMRIGCMCLMDMNFDVNEISELELKIQYFMDHGHSGSKREITEYCIEQGDFYAAFKSDPTSLLQMDNNKIIKYKGILQRSNSMIRIELNDVRELINCKNVPLYMIKSSFGDKNDLIQICLNNGYMEEATELVNRAVIYTYIGLY
eukprot:NODE_134_length_18141_cov_0.186066.p2 type:complete len:953 gc:universal NODE_134_length_18141_cov_0.186066:4941-7799(+)